MEHSYHRICIAISLLLLPLASACGVPGRDWVPTDGDGGLIVSDPSCPEARNVIPDITCGSAEPDRVCAGSCGQTLDGIVGVGLSSCRCIDSGSGFGGQWVCDTTMCDTTMLGDGGMGSDTSRPMADSGVTTTDAAVCPPAEVAGPTEPGCTASQRSQITSIETQADYDAFVADARNDECNGCLSLAIVSCATSFGCDRPAGDLFCCLDDACGDDPACRMAAFDGACSAETTALTRCANSVTACGLDPSAPPSECF